jgi:hypothetical protein
MNVIAARKNAAKSLIVVSFVNPSIGADLTPDLAINNTPAAAK